MRLVAEVTARIEWRIPPKDKAEEMMREAANVRVAKAAFELRYSSGSITDDVHRQIRQPVTKERFEAARSKAQH